MQSILAYLENVLATYWGQSKYQLFLYIAIIVILLMEKESWKKITFAWYGLVCFVGLLNPITVKITSKVWGESVAYYCRQISLIPIFIIIAYGIIVLISKIHKKKKLMLVIAFVVIIITNGHQIYSETWYTKADNFNKVPNEVIEIAKYIDTQKEKYKIAAPSYISSYMRQYGDVCQLQGRVVYYANMEANLQSDTPDVKTIMETAGENKCKYVIAKKTEKAKIMYKDNGHEPCFETEHFMVFLVSNVNRWEATFDDNNRMIEKTYIDEHNNKEQSSLGYNTIEYSYDYQGNVQSEKYYDKNKKLITLRENQYGKKYKYDEERRVIQECLLDQKGNVMEGKSGYARIDYIYDDDGNKEYEWFYDVDNKLTNIISGESGRKFEYDEKGRLIYVKYLNKKGGLIKIKSGYAMKEFSYDVSGDIMYEIYYDEKEQRIY